MCKPTEFLRQVAIDTDTGEKSGNGTVFTDNGTDGTGEATKTGPRKEVDNGFGVLMIPSSADARVGLRERSRG